MTNPQPYYIIIDLDEIAARNETARHLVAGFAAEMPALTDFWRNLGTALADSMTLSAEVTRLAGELDAARLDLANLLAAIRATLAAYADGEGDPMWYLRDEVAARRARSGGHGRSS